MDSYVFITGASSGFGKACAEIFAKNGYNLVLSARRLDRLEKLRNELHSTYGVHVEIGELDVRDEIQVTNFVDALPIKIQTNIA
jgi:NADP-dependent 3-hydroxy acid dehydrogenase YdfG